MATGFATIRHQVNRRRTILVVGCLIAGGVAVLVCAGWVWVRRHRPSPDAGVIATLQSEMRHRTFEVFYEYGRTRAASAPLQQQYFGDSSMAKDHFRFMAYLDTSLLPTMLKGMRVGTTEQREHWIASQTRWLENYWQTMPAPERARVQAALRSPQGQKLIQDSAKFYLNELSTTEKQQLAPLIGQITAMLEQIGRD